MKKRLLFFGLLTISSFSFGQIVNWQTAPWILDTDLSESIDKTYVSGTRVEHKPGFKYTPGGRYRAYILPEEEYSETPLWDQNAFNSRPVDKSLHVGYTPGTPEVSLSGGATYNIPIYIPPGTRGMQPALSISYSSQAGNGALGYGWNLGGLSAISRAGKTLLHNGETQPVVFNNSDWFTLNGNRLVAVSGGYGGNLTEYDLEMEQADVKKITSFGSPSPQSFEVEYYNGTKVEFGTAQHSFVNNMLWYISKVTDAYGNYMTYEYEELLDDESEINIKSIKYTGNTNEGIDPYNEINFSYQLRDDKNITYSGGLDFYAYTLIDKIEVLCEGSRVKTYEFNYGEKGHSYLTEVVEKGANGGALNATIFKYGEGGITAMYDVVKTGGGEISHPDSDELFGDFNGDGYTDILVSTYEIDDIPAYQRFNRIYLNMYEYLHTGTFDANGNPIFNLVWSSPYPAGVYTNYTYYGLNVTGDQLLTNSDFNGDGLEDMMAYAPGSSGTYSDATLIPFIANSSGVGFTQRTSVPIASGYYAIGDFNGDMRTDVFCYRESTYQHDEAVFVGFDNSGSYQMCTNDVTSQLAGVSFLEHKTPHAINFDADGVQEIEFRDELVYVTDLNISGSFGSYSMNHTIAKSYSLPSGYQYHRDGDFNGDGITDKIMVNEISGIFTWNLWRGTGTGYSASNLENFSGQITVLDINGDGKSDVLRRVPAYVGSIPSSPIPGQTKFITYISTGLYLEEINTIVTEDISGNLSQVLTPGHFTKDDQIDVLMNGIESILSEQGFGINEQPTASRWVVIALNENDDVNKLKALKNGHNHLVEFDYEYMHSGLDFFTPSPYMNLTDYRTFIAPASYVKSVTVKTPLGNDNTTNYTYEGMVLSTKGRGLLGFDKMTVHNLLTDAISETVSQVNQTYGIREVLYSQEFLGTEIRSRTDYIYDVDELGASWPADPRLFTYLKETTATTYRYSQPFTVTNAEYFYNSYHNAYKTRTQTDDNPMKETVHSGAAYFPSSTTSSILVGGVPVFWDQVSYAYNNEHSVLTESFSKNGHSLNTVYTYDGFGNISTKQVQGSTPNTPSSSRLTTFTYERNGRFMLTEENDFGISRYFREPKFGNILRTQYPTGLSDRSTYDEFGGLLSTTDVRGLSAQTVTEFDPSSSGLPGTPLYLTTATGDGAPMAKVWYDGYGLELKKQSSNFSGEVAVASTYDDMGRIKTKTQPYFVANPTIYTNTYTYHNKYHYLSQYDIQYGSSSTYSYGHNLSSHETTSSVNQDGKTKHKVTNGEGKLLRTIDENEKWLNFTYDYKGQMTEVRDHSSNLLSSISYDDLGHQTSLWDPNAGTTSYVYDAFGTLYSQTNPNGSESLTYDLNNGQLLTKTGPDGVWNYEYYGDGYNLGQLKRIYPQGADALGRQEAFEYNSYGDLIKRTEFFDGEDLVYDFEYDALGRLMKQTYPGNVSQEWTYDSEGNITDVNFEGTTVWSLNNVNAFGQPTSYTMGNGITTTKTYYNTGHPSEIISGSFQHLKTYFNSSKTDINRRDDILASLQENFTYDNLNRLTQASVAGTSLVTDVSYQGNGNIASKTEVGTYTYDGVRKNAVESVSNDLDYITSDQNISYNYYGNPETIEENNLSVEYSYGIDQERRKMVVTDFNTSAVLMRYYFGNYERQTANGETHHVYYINAGDGLAAMYVKKDNDPGQLKYVYKDYLGSITSLTDAAGNVITGTEHSFDAWGNYRNPQTWERMAGPDPAKPVWLWRGYTGHEHLFPLLGGAGVGSLIHMNGRLYDPLLGRMLSPDNNVQSPNNYQNYNRYAYVMNNPMKFTDPSGEFIFTAAALIAAPFTAGASLALLPYTIGADLGAWQGYKMAKAHGTTGLKMVGYIFGGAVIGGYSGAAAASAGAAVGAAVGGGFLGGAIAGAAGGAVAGVTSGYWMTLLGGGSLLQASKNAFNSAVMGAVSGAVIGGIFGGIDASLNGKNFLTGRDPYYEASLNDYNVVPQEGPMDCKNATLESIEKMNGGNRTQVQFREAGDEFIKQNPNASLEEYFESFGFDVREPAGWGPQQIGRAMEKGYPTVINEYISSNQSHTITITRIRQWTPNGRFRVWFSDPQGGIVRSAGWNNTVANPNFSNGSYLFWLH